MTMADIPIYTSLRETPPHLKSQGQWKRRFKKVRRGAKPAAYFMIPEYLDEDQINEDFHTIIDDSGDTPLVGRRRVHLYADTDMVAYEPSARTIALWQFEDIYLKHSQRDSLIMKSDLRTGEDLDAWMHPPRLNWLFLNSSLIAAHVSGRHIIGVKSRNITPYAIIDLDFHGRDKEVFLKQLEALLDGFWGRDRLHLRVSKGGVALHLCFDGARPLSDVTLKLRSFLVDLGRQHPELESAAIHAGMKPLKDLEIYPTIDGNGVRLPLCRGTVMLLDKPLALVRHRQRDVQDVEGYMRWLNDHKRTLMERSDILHFVGGFVDQKSHKKEKKKKSSSRKSEPNPCGWKGRLYANFYEFWIEGNANGHLLNDHIHTLALAMKVREVKEEKAIEVLKRFVQELPDNAKTASQRLLQEDYAAINKVIISTVKRIYAEPEDNHNIMDASLKARPRFDPTLKETWAASGVLEAIETEWTADERAHLAALFTKVLHIVSWNADDTAMSFVNEIIGLTRLKQHQGKEWGYRFFQTWMEDKFPDVACKKRKKVQLVFQALVDAKILRVIRRGFKGRATLWATGELADLAISRHKPKESVN